IDGVTTLLGFHRALLRHPCFAAGETCNDVVESAELAEQSRELLSHTATTVPAASDGRLREHLSVVELAGRRFEITTLVPEPPHAELVRRRRERSRGGAQRPAKDAVTTPMQGTVLSVEVEEGQDVVAGQVICVVEAMKMENEITAHRDGTVTELSVAPGQAVKTGQAVCVVAQDGA